MLMMMMLRILVMLPCLMMTLMFALLVSLCSATNGADVAYDAVPKDVCSYA